MYPVLVFLQRKRTVRMNFIKDPAQLQQRLLSVAQRLISITGIKQS